MSPSPADIDDLLRRYEANNPIIIEALVEQYRSTLYHLALSILNDISEAEDAVQDALVKATLHLDSYIPGTNFKAWLYTITVNVCRGYLRKQRTRRNLENLLRVIHLTATPPENPEQYTLDDESGKQLWAAVDRLGEKQRLVLIMRIIHQLSIHEIACILGTNDKTIYTRLYQAFDHLREQLSSSIDNN